MRYKKMIQKILGTELEKQGFTYMPNSSWSYERVKDQVWQSVSVVRERYCKGYIRMVFMTCHRKKGADYRRGGVCGRSGRRLSNRKRDGDPHEHFRGQRGFGAADDGENCGAQKAL